MMNWHDAIDGGTYRNKSAQLKEIHMLNQNTTGSVKSKPITMGSLLDRP